jgi:Na+-driven multidrug efflux pump
MRAAWLAAVLNLALTSGLTFGLWGLPELGVVGAAIGTSAAFAVQGLWVAIGARRALASQHDATRPRTAPPLGALPPVPALPINETVRLPALPNAELSAIPTGPPAPEHQVSDSIDDLPGQGEAAPARASSWPHLRAVLRVSGPTLAERIIYHGGYLVFSSYIGRLGDAAMTAHQALLAIESLGFIAADGFGIAAGAIVARKLGARDPHCAERGARLAQRLGFGVLCAVGLFFLVAADGLVALFTDDAAVQILGARCLRAAVVAQPLMALVDALAYALRGAGETKTPLRAALVGPVLVRLSVCWLLTFHFELGLLGIWIGTNFDWAVRAVWLERAFARGAWKTASV